MVAVGTENVRKNRLESTRRGAANSVLRRYLNAAFDEYISLSKPEGMVQLTVWKCAASIEQKLFAHMKFEARGLITSADYVMKAKLREDDRYFISQVLVAWREYADGFEDICVLNCAKTVNQTTSRRKAVASEPRAARV